MARHRLAGRTAVAALALVTGLATATSAAAAPATPDAPAVPAVRVATGTVSGTVTRQAGPGVGGVHVAAYVDPLGAPVQTARTDTSGRYTLRALPGDVVVQVCADPAGAPGAPVDGWVAACTPGTTRAGLGPGVALPAGGAVTGVDLVVRNGGSVTGVVTGGPGAPLGGVAVTATGYGLDVDVVTARRGRAQAAAAGVLRPSAAGLAETDAVGRTVANGIVHVRTTTAADGSYRLAGLPASSDWQICFDGADATGGYQAGYQVRCHPGTTPAASTPVTVAVGATTTGIDEVLPRAGTLQGTVTGTAGAPLAGARVQIATPDGRAVAEVATDPQGRWRRTGLAGAYTVCARPPAGTAVLGQCVGGLPGAAAVTGAVVTVPAQVGTTRDLALTAPAGAARVTVVNGGGHAVAGARVHLEGGPTAAAGVADTDGAVVLPDLVPGVYTACGGGTSDPSGSWAAGCTPPLTVTAGTTTPAALTFAPGAAATGVVLASDGSPVPGAWVSTGGTRDPSAWTGADGSFRITGLTVGTSYRVCASPPFTPGAPGSLNGCAASYVVARAGVTDGVTVTVPPGAAVTGTVTAGGRPVAGAVVTVGTDRLPTRTDAAGRFAAGGLHVSGGWTPVCADPGPTPAPAGPLHGCEDAPVVAGATVDVGVALPGGAAAVSGRVTGSDGSPAPDVRVLLGGPFGTEIARTRADGTWAAGGLAAPGRVALCFAPAGASALVPECYDDLPFSTGRPPALVRVDPKRTTTGVDVVLTVGATIAGTAADATGRELGGAVASLYDADGHPVGSPAVTAPVAAGGTFTFAGLVHGTYRVCVAPGPDDLVLAPAGYRTGCTGGATSPATATGVAVSEGATTTVAVVLPVGAALTGRVVDAAGAPVAGAEVTVTPGSTVRTAGDGSYRLLGLPARSVSVCVTDAASSATDPGYLDSCSTTTLTAGTTTTFDPPLRPAGGLSGRVARSGAAVAGIAVRVVGPAAVDVTVSTDRTGAYHVPRLGPGSYTVCADQPAAPEQCLGGGTNRSTSTPVTVATGYTSGVDLALPDSSRVTVTVTDTAGTGLHSVFVEFSRPDGQYLTGGTTTQGRVSAVVPVGGVRICAETPDAGAGYGGSSTTGYVSACVDRTVTAAPTAVTIALVAGDALTGTIRDGRGQPLGGAVTVLDASTRAPVTGVSTGSSGSSAGAYRIQALPAGDYLVCFTASVPGSAAPPPFGYPPTCPGATGGVAVAFHGHGLSHVVDVTVPDGGAFAGRVTDQAGNPLAGAVVQLDDRDYYSLTGPGATTPTDGSFQVPGVATGPETLCWDTSAVTAGPVTGYASGCRSEQGTAGVVTTVADLALGVGARVTGTVSHFADSRAVSVWARGPGGWESRVGVASDGSFTLRGLPTGAVTVSVTSSRTDATATVSLTLAAGDDLTGVALAFDGAGG